MMLEAAEAGQGIAIGRRSLIEEALRKGTLVALYSEPVDDEIGYYFCCAPEAIGRRKIAAFRDWLSARTLTGSDPDTKQIPFRTSMAKPNSC